MADVDRALWVDGFNAATYRTRAKIYDALKRPLDAANDRSRAAYMQAYSDIPKFWARRRDKTEPLDEEIWSFSAKMPGKTRGAYVKTLFPAADENCLDGARHVLTIILNGGSVSVRPLYAGPDGEMRVAQDADGMTFWLGAERCRIAIAIGKRPVLKQRSEAADSVAIPRGDDTKEMEAKFYDEAPNPNREGNSPCETAVVEIRVYWGAVDVHEDRSMSNKQENLDDAVARPIEPHIFGDEGCAIEIRTAKAD